MINSPKSLISRFLNETVVYIAAGSAGCLALILCAVLYLEKQQESEARSDLTSAMVDNLTTPIERVDVTRIGVIANAFQSSKEIAGLRVIDKEGNALSATGHSSTTHPPDTSIVLETDAGNISGHLEIWWQTSGLLSTSKGGALLIGIPILFVVSAVFASLVIFRALRKLVIQPMDALQPTFEVDQAQNTQFLTSTTLTTREFVSFHQNIQGLRETLTEERLRSVAAMRDRELALRWRERSDAALTTTLEMIRQTIVIVDHDGNEVASRISQPFKPRHLSLLVAVAAEPENFDEVLKELGATNTRKVSADAELGEAREFILNAKCLLRATTVTIEGHRALIIRDITNEESIDAAMDEILSATKTGIALYSPKHELQLQRGAELNRLSVSADEGDPAALTFPEIVKNSLRNLGEDLSIKVKDRYFHVRSVGLRSGMLCVVHHDVSDIRLFEREVQTGRNLRTIGQLTSGVAHDFNNILGIIIGNLELLRLKAGPDTTDEIQEALQAAANGAATIRHLLAFSNEKPLTANIVDLGNLLRENLKLLRNAAGQGVIVLLEESPNIQVSIDEAMLTSALLNLVVNARDAMGGQGEIRISLQLCQAKDDISGPMARIKVQDTGPGVSEDHSSEIFEPYFTTKDKSLGTGLGLAMVKSFMDRSGGTITHRNTPEGAQFMLDLRCYQGPTVSLDRPTPAVTSQPNLKRRRSVVVLDDELALLRMTRLVLESLNYRVETFSEPAEAREWLQHYPDTDLLLIDYMMPKCTGLEFVHENKRLLKDVAIVMCSGNLTDEVQMQARATGIRHFQDKPFNLTSIEAILTRALNDKAESRASEPRLKVINSKKA